MPTTIAHFSASPAKIGAALRRAGGADVVSANLVGSRTNAAIDLGTATGIHTAAVSGTARLWSACLTHVGYAVFTRLTTTVQSTARELPAAAVGNRTAVECPARLFGARLAGVRYAIEVGTARSVFVTAR